MGEIELKCPRLYGMSKDEQYEEQKAFLEHLQPRAGQLPRDHWDGYQEWEPPGHNEWQRQNTNEPYAEKWETAISDSETERVRFLKEQLKGKTLIDLGGGVLAGDSYAKLFGPGPMQSVAERLGVDTYVNVDAYYLGTYPFTTQEPWVKTKSLDMDQLKDMNVVYLQADMLHFLLGMADSTRGVAFAINGIDDNIVPERDYHRKLAKELARVLPEGGLVLSSGSDVSQYLSGEGFELAPYDKGSGGLTETWVKKRSSAGSVN